MGILNIAQFASGHTFFVQVGVSSVQRGWARRMECCKRTRRHGAYVCMFTRHKLPLVWAITEHMPSMLGMLTQVGMGEEDGVLQAHTLEARAERQGVHSGRHEEARHRGADPPPALSAPLALAKRPPYGRIYAWLLALLLFS